MWILTRRSPQDCSVRVHITTVAAVRWATDLCGSLSRILAVSWSQCVCVCVCRLSSVACVSDAGLPGVSQIVGPVRLGLGACWRRLHHCVSLFVCYLSAACLLPAACCLLPACCLPCVAFFHRCIFSASCGNTFPTFYFTRVRAPRVFSAHLIFSRNATQTQHPWC